MVLENIDNTTGKEKEHHDMPVNLQQFLQRCAPELCRTLIRVADRTDAELYVVGGTIRDWLLGRAAKDIDIAVADDALELAKLIRKELGGGAIVDLSGQDDEAVRVVWGDQQLDIASFRTGAKTIEEDLKLRDFTINALAVPVLGLVTERTSVRLLDPTGGEIDLRAGRIRHCPGAFAADPIRMLRGYRLGATLGFMLVDETTAALRKHAFRIANVSAERISKELQLIFASSRTTETIRAMARDGLLRWLLPELFLGEGVEQPEFHHLDVLGHSFLALEMMERIIQDPQTFFKVRLSVIAQYLADEETVRCLKWAALLHDIGKPVTKEPHAGQAGRVTFYRHDEVGGRIFRDFAARSRWSSADIDRVGGLISKHMHPFHLCNVQRESNITIRSVLKLCRRAGTDLSGLFLLALADSLASRGEKKPERMEEELIVLFDTVQKIYNEHIAPVLHGPRLLSGKDLIDVFHLQPGPRFKEILLELEVVRSEGKVTDRPAALCWVERYLQDNPEGLPTGRMGGC